MILVSRSNDNGANKLQIITDPPPPVIMNSLVSHAHFPAAVTSAAGTTGSAGSENSAARGAHGRPAAVPAGPPRVALALGETRASPSPPHGRLRS